MEDFASLYPSTQKGGKMGLLLLPSLLVPTKRFILETLRERDSLNPEGSRRIS